MRSLQRQAPERPSIRAASILPSPVRPGSPMSGYLQLQRFVGNRAGQSLLGLVPAGAVQASGRSAEPWDPWEKEADRAATAAFDGHAEPSTLTPLDGPSPSAPSLTPGMRAALASLEGRGRALPEPVRGELGARMGHDFEGVRVHDDAGAGRLALALNARAFTLGRHVVFAPGEYAPTTPAGGRLLVHELAHTVQQRTAGPSAAHVQRLSYGEVKEATYGAMIHGVRRLQGAAFAGARAHAREALPPHLHGVADTLLGACEGVADILVSLCYAVLGLLVGAGEAVFGILEGLVTLATAAIRYLVAWVKWLFGRPEELEELAGDLERVVTGFVPGLRRLVNDWMERFEHASPERQTLMIGELTGEVLVFIATLGGSAAKAGRLPRLTLPVPALVLAPEGALAVRAATVTVGVESAVAVTGTGLAMAMTGNSGGGGGGPDDDIEKFLKEQEERIGPADDIELVEKESRGTNTAGQAHGSGGVSVEELTFAARKERLFSFNFRTRKLGTRGSSRAAPASADEAIVAVGKDGRWRLAGGIDIPSHLRETFLAELRKMLKKIDPDIELAE